MHRFMVSPDSIQDGTVIITGGDLKHLRQVLRLKQGDIIHVFDGDGTEYEARLLEVGKLEARAEIEASGASAAEPKKRVTLYQGLPKAEKMDLVARMAVELGIYRIVPVLTQRTVVRLDGQDKARKHERWNRIAREAAKQCRRTCVPEVALPVTLSEALQSLGNADAVITLYEGEQKKCLKELLKCYNINKIGDIALFIGPEGGFSNDEAIEMVKSGAMTAGLGKRILRTETAAVSVISIIMHELGEMQ